MVVPFFTSGDLMQSLMGGGEGNSGASTSTAMSIASEEVD